MVHPKGLLGMSAVGLRLAGMCDAASWIKRQLCCEYGLGACLSESAIVIATEYMQKIESLLFALSGLSDTRTAAWYVPVCACTPAKGWLGCKWLCILD